MKEAVCLFTLNMVNQKFSGLRLCYADCKSSMESKLVASNRICARIIEYNDEIRSNAGQKRWELGLLVVLGDAIVLFSMLPLANELSKPLIMSNDNKLKILLAFPILHYSEYITGKQWCKCKTTLLMIPNRLQVRRTWVELQQDFQN